MSPARGSPASVSVHKLVAEKQARLKPRGSSQGGLRQYNERVILQAVRLHGPVAAADIARLTKLTAQTVSIIVKRLLDDGLLLKTEPMRGRVGQPSVPLRLNPEGAFSIGVKVGRRSLDTLLVDFTGTPRQRWSLEYTHADPAELVPAIAEHVQAVRQMLGPDRSELLQGIGIAAPLSMGSWQALLGMPKEVSQRWDDTDLAAEVHQRTGLPVQAVKDTSAACIAELTMGHGRSIQSFLYLFVDTFIGGGLVLESRIRLGLHGNAGAVGSLPLSVARAGEPEPAQLLSVASFRNLEQLYLDAGLDLAALQDERCTTVPPYLPVTRQWMQPAAAAIAQVVASSACLLDLESVILDGSFRSALLGMLMDDVSNALDLYDWEGVARPSLLPGAIGADARALGGAMLPLYEQFAPDRELFLKVS